MSVFETIGIVYLCLLDVIIILGNAFVFILICVNPKLRNATGTCSINNLHSEFVGNF